MALTTLSSIQPRAGGFLVSEAEHFRSREQIVVLSGQVLKAGHVLGKVVVGASAVSAPASGNTGNGVMGAVTAGNAARVGTYQLVIIEAAANAGRFEVADPNGLIIGTGSVGVAFAGGGLSFTLADGATDFVAGDRFSITISGGTEKFKEYNPANTDGSQFPAAISWDVYDASAADVNGAAVVRDAQVNVAELTWFSGATSGQIAAAIALMAGEPMRVIARPSV
jgi:hypothetical protein